LATAVETLLETTIDEHYLTARQPGVQATYEELRRRCHQAGILPPHLNTVRARIGRITHRIQLQRRGHAREARDRYEPVTGEFPAAEWPLAVVQIDHTPADIIVVDDRHRLPVGRPTITVAIDVFSRVVAGFYVSLDPPSALAVGLCLAQAILPKDTWLANHQIDTPWPICGLMDSVLADNAPEFRGTLLQRACAEYRIDLHWRPVGRPHFGGHIERLCGTLNQAIHTLPGTTFSNPTARGEYPSTQQAAMTLSELEHWLAVYIIQVYHQKLHHGIGMSPLKKYEQGIFGDSEHPGCGLRPLPLDLDRLRLDFLPYVERSVQPSGFRIDDIFYYHEVLKPWIRSTVTGTPHVPRKFIVRRDPRDISTVYFFDPELSQYFAVPYRRLAAPSMSVWELREVRRQLKAEGQRNIDEAALFAGYERLRALEAQAVDKTLKSRRQAQRRRQHQAREPLQTPATPSTPTPGRDWPEDDAITPFDDLAVGLPEKKMR
jgi:putative transposase